MNDEQYLAWLRDQSAIHNVILSAGVNVDGVEMTREISKFPFVTTKDDSRANEPHIAAFKGGMSLTEEVSLTGAAGLSYGDAEIENEDGSRDGWLNHIWKNRRIEAFAGDPRWPRAQYRSIFKGVIADIDTKDTRTLNIKLRDMIERLNFPLSEETLGGTGTNKAAIKPLLFGECFNITPLLTNPATLEYQIHNGPVEDIYEVRDNGKPVAIIKHLASGKFNLTALPLGTITVSAQGDKFGGIYRDTIAQLVARVATGFGSTTERLTEADIDTANFAAFDAAHQQAVGLYVTDGIDVIAAIQKLAASVGAQALMSRQGKLRLIQISLPAPGVPTMITPAQMRGRDLKL